MDKALEHRADRLAEALRDELQEEKLVFASVDRPRNAAHIDLVLGTETDVGEVEKFLRKNFSILEVTERRDANLRLELVADQVDYIRTSTVDQAIKTIRNRADQFGVAEPTIAKRGKTNVLIQLPGNKDPERAIQNIGRTAQLEFKMVDEEASQVFDSITDLPEGVVKRDSTFQGPGGKAIREIFFELNYEELSDQKRLKQELRVLLEPKLSSDREIAYGPTVLPNGANKENSLRTYVLESRAGITGDYLTDAQVQQNPDLPTEYYVTMTFDAKGAKIFSKLTEENVQRHMAIVLDDTVNSAPTIQEKIGGGTARITLGRAGSQQEKFEEARDLSLVLKAGALPAPVEVREQRQVGKTLGEESVEAGKMAIGIGGLLVLIFMLIYYRASGVIANVALVLNIVLVLAVLAMLEATLTLPGMAGIVLTIGMAVDANVIIFERIREELRIGKTPRAAIEAGYGKAFSTIMDANITTLIAGIVLFEYGSGPVKGFAVTLMIGILCSMFTAIVVTRLIYDFFAGRRRLQSLSI